MASNDFSRIATDYATNSHVQKAASDELFRLLDIKEADDVLDLGCGTGNLTRRIRAITKGRVVGVDGAEGMISEAVRRHAEPGISFELRPAEGLHYEAEFDVIFCNSAFQWFDSPEAVLRGCRRALRQNGRLGIQAAATTNYSPNIIQAIDAVRKDPQTAGTFAHFRSPWLLRESVEEYRSFFERAGFHVDHARIEKLVQQYTPAEVFATFNSGPAAGYLNPGCYDVPLDQAYIDRFREIARDTFIAQADSRGIVGLTFFRLYLLARKL